MPKSVLRAVLGRMQFTLHATRRTPHGASRLVRTMSAWLAKTRRPPSRQSRNARVYGHTTTATHKPRTPPSPPPHAPSIHASMLLARWGCIHTFKSEKHNPHRLTVRAGLTRLTLFPGNVDLRIANVNDDRSALSKSTPLAAFIRWGESRRARHDKQRHEGIPLFCGKHFLWVGCLLNARNRWFWRSDFLRSENHWEHRHFGFCEVNFFLVFVLCSWVTGFIHRVRGFQLHGDPKVRVSGKQKW